VCRSSCAARQIRPKRVGKSPTPTVSLARQRVPAPEAITVVGTGKPGFSAGGHMSQSTKTVDGQVEFYCSGSNGCHLLHRTIYDMKTRIPTLLAHCLVSTVMAIAAGSVLGTLPGQALAQSSAMLTVSARVVAPCTITSSSLQSDCSERTLAQQSDIRNGSARITTSGVEAAVTHKGGPSPRMEKSGDRILVRF